MLTARGLGALAAAGGAFIAGAILHYPELGVIAAGAGGALVIGAGWVVRRPALAVERTVEPDRVERGGQALGMLRVSNTSRFTSAPMTASDRCGSENPDVQIPKLRPGARFRTTYELPTGKRGIITVGPLAVARQDPLGCWRRAQRTGSLARLVVHPTVHTLRALPSGATRSLDGADTNRAERGSTTFHALRDYVPGDDLRHVHWRSSARIGTLMVREHVDQSLPEVVVVLDTEGETYDDDSFEAAIEVAASVAVAATRGRFPVRLLTTDGRLRTGRGVASDANGLLDLLAEVVPGTQPLASVLPRLTALSYGDLLMVVTARVRPSDLAAVSQVTRRFRRSALVLIGSGDPGSVPVGPDVSVIRVASGAAFAQAWNGMRW